MRKRGGKQTKLLLDLGWGRNTSIFHFPLIHNRCHIVLIPVHGCHCLPHLRSDRCGDMWDVCEKVNHIWGPLISPVLRGGFNTSGQAWLQKWVKQKTKTIPTITMCIIHMCIILFLFPGSFSLLLLVTGHWTRATQTLPSSPAWMRSTISLAMMENTIWSMYQ